MKSRDPPVGVWSQGPGHALEFPKQKWTCTIKLLSAHRVEELVYMNRIRFSTSQASQNNIFDTDDPKPSCASESEESLLSVGSKRKNPRDGEDLRARQTRWKQINGDHRQQHGPPLARHWPA